MSGPVKKIRAGQVSCAIWENEIRVDGHDRTILKATIERRYKDRDGEWKSSGSFSRTELPLAIHCMQKAFEAMLDKSNDEESGGVAEEVIAG